MYRQIEKKLLRWKQDPQRKPLLIKGAGQVGKTYSIRKFGNEQYHQTAEINFKKERNFIHLFKSRQNPHDILEYLKISFMNVDFCDTTLLYFDEVQECPQVMEAITTMRSVLPCDILCSGKYVTDHEYENVEVIEMVSMGFIEFLMAFGMQQSILERITESMEELHTIPEVIHEKLNDLFTYYMIVGGMPEVVKTYVETKSFKACLQIQRRIVNDYLNDMATYAKGSDKVKTRECYLSIPLQLYHANKKFRYHRVKEGYSARYYDSSLKWLKNSGMVVEVQRLSKIQWPLHDWVEEAVFKLYMSDSGLFISQLKDADVQAILRKELDLYHGVLYETITAQILHRKALVSYYFEPSQTSQIDFVIPFEQHIIPIHVAKRMTNSKSFYNFIEKYHPKRAWHFSQERNTIVVENSIHKLPLYLLEIYLYHENKVR